MRRQVATLAAVLALAAGALPAGAAAEPAGGPCAGKPWMDTRLSAGQRADALLPEMTLDEKAAMTHAVSDDRREREVPAIDRLCIPALRLNNGPAGVGSGGVVQPNATALPAPLGTAASFDPAVARAYGEVEGRETRAVGRNQMEGPDVNIARTPLNGRTFEAYGEDPYLAGRIAAADVRGIQSQGVIATTKHFVANNQETDRGTIDEHIDDRTLREIYLPAFETAVKDGRSGSVMCAKNKVNGTYACEHGELQQSVLKDEWGYDGYTVSDFTSCHDTVGCATGGMDLELPEAKFYGDALKAAVQDGRVSPAHLDDHVRRVLTTMFRFGLFDRPQGTTPIDVEAGGAVARKAAEAGTVLLKNEKGVLPLDRKDKSIAVIGPGSATAMTGGGGSAGTAPAYSVDPLSAITERAGRSRTVTHAAGMGPVDLGPQPALPTSAVTPEGGTAGEHGWTARYYANTAWSGDPVLTRTDPYVERDPSGGVPAPGLPPNGWSIRWTATFTAPVDGDYTFHLTNHARAKLFLDGGQVIDNGGGFPGTTRSTTVHLAAGGHPIRVDWAKSGGQAMIELAWKPPANASDTDIEQAVAAAEKADVPVLFLANKDSEALDRPDLSLPGYQDELVERVAAANPRTVVVLNTGGPVAMPWLDQVAGVVEAWYPGEEDGNAIASVLFGDTDPAGRLPITFPKSLADTPADTPARYPGVGGVATYAEGLDVGYRHYDARGIEPLFPFGYGLSYTSFRLGRLRVADRADGGALVTVDVANTGRRKGSQVVQVYVGGADDGGSLGDGQVAPPRRLEGFAKVALAPGRHRRVRIELTPRAFAHWDTSAHAWRVSGGAYPVSAGTSSRDLPLRATVRREGGTVP